MFRFAPLAMAATLLTATGAWSQAPAAPRPVLKVGEVTTYAVTSRHNNQNYNEKVTITEATAEGYKARVEQGEDASKTREMVLDTDMGLILTASGSRFAPASRNLKFPLEVGATWESKSEVSLPDGGKSRISSDNKVVGMEKIRTPAGEFEAYKVETRGGVQGVTWNGFFRVVQTQWYAPSVQRVVRTEYKEQRTSGLDTVRELKSVEPAR